VRTDLVIKIKTLNQNLDTLVNFCNFENNKIKTIKVDSLKIYPKNWNQ
jgi:hypothetical protein